MGYRHEAFLYAGHDEFMAGVLAFVREALGADEPILVVVGDAKLAALRGELGGDGEQVLFADMAEVGANPARIIPAWQEFLERHAAPGQRLWGVGEPIWAERGAAELAECQRHEALLNVVFSDPAFSLLCPYDVATLDAAVIDEARRTHPFVGNGGESVASDRYAGAASLAAFFDDPLPEPRGAVERLDFGSGALSGLRRFVSARGLAAGLAPERVADLVIAVNEVATNSVIHGGGEGALRVWREDGRLVCEVRDAGHIDDPLAGHRRPRPGDPGGRGLWLANQLCELVQVRTGPERSTIRLHMRLADA